jgi:hypothetical protein
VVRATSADPANHGGQRELVGDVNRQQVFGHVNCSRRSALVGSAFIRSG